MTITFEHHPHPRIATRKRAGPPKTADEHVGLNGKIALALTTAVGTMWCAYVFAILALLVVPQAIQGGLLTFVQWVSQTFIQLAMLSVINGGPEHPGTRLRQSGRHDVTALTPAAP